MRIAIANHEGTPNRRAFLAKASDADSGVSAITKTCEKLAINFRRNSVRNWRSGLCFLNWQGAVNHAPVDHCPTQLVKVLSRADRWLAGRRVRPCSASLDAPACAGPRAHHSGGCAHTPDRPAPRPRAGDQREKAAPDRAARRAASRDQAAHGTHRRHLDRSIAWPQRRSTVHGRARVRAKNVRSPLAAPFAFTLVNASGLPDPVGPVGCCHVR